MNLRPDIGGDLEEFVDHEEAWNIVHQVDEFFLKHGATEELYSPDEDEISNILRKSAASGIKFIPIIQRHMGSDKTPAIIDSIKTELERNGVIFLLETEIIDIIADDIVKGAIARDQEKMSLK